MLFTDNIRELLDALYQRDQLYDRFNRMHQVVRKAGRSPSLRLRFGRRSDPELSPVSLNIDSSFFIFIRCFCTFPDEKVYWKINARFVYSHRHPSKDSEALFQTMFSNFILSPVVEYSETVHKRKPQLYIGCIVGCFPVYWKWMLILSVSMENLWY